MAVVDKLNADVKRKRHLWLISLTFPMSPLWGIGLSELTGNPHMLWVPVVLFYLIMPVLDYLIGDDKHDLLGMMEEEASLSPFYRFMVHGLLPVVYLTWLAGAWYAATQSLPWDAYFALGIAHGWGLAFAINAGHEIGHKTDKLSKWVSLFMLFPSFLGHFRVEHNSGHHSDVATPRDHATSWFGESYYHFMGREIPGAWRRAWALESIRARRRGYSKWSLKNEVVISTVLSVLLWGGIVAVLGLAVLPYILLTWIVSLTALSSQNYIAHYGLLRDKRPDGKYLPCQPHHSWNCNQLVTNLTSYNLARHSDHHAHPARHYQHLRTFPKAPQLPYGYMTMFLIGFIPPLFRRVMDHRVLDNVDGDMRRVLTPELVARERAATKV
ncbi:alkane 1-monooxygenase [Fretibacter rubidus]|uniref:alkane 1-monooxygenase n=1 Tax=Fretibacter rubidus TaxID=570162 RepID=UPI00352ACAC9